MQNGEERIIKGVSKRDLAGPCYDRPDPLFRQLSVHTAHFRVFST